MCRWLENVDDSKMGNFFFSSFYSLFFCSSTVFPQFSESIFIFWVHPRDAVSYDFCMYNFSFEYFHSVWIWNDIICILCYNFHEIHFFCSYSVLGSWNRWDSFKYLFEWLKVFFFFAVFKEKTVTKERFVLEHDILHGHFV